MIRGHFVLGPKHLDSQMRYVKHIFKGSFLLGGPQQNLIASVGSLILRHLIFLKE